MKQFRVGLIGQFDEEIVRHRIVGPLFFGSPVVKNGEEEFPPNRFAHLSPYIFNLNFTAPEPFRRVFAENQFGDFEFLTGNPVALLAPARKFDPGSEFPPSTSAPSPTVPSIP